MFFLSFSFFETGQENDQRFAKVDKSDSINKPRVSKWACFLDPGDDE